VGDVASDVQASEFSESRGCKALPMGVFVEGELHLSWMQIFPSPFIVFYSLFFILLFFISFFLQEANQGTLPWHGDQW
jgi:hypothetical protein